jgi:hypothetical protein
MNSIRQNVGCFFGCCCCFVLYCSFVLDAISIQGKQYKFLENFDSNIFLLITLLRGKNKQLQITLKKNLNSHKFFEKDFLTIPTTT